MVLRTLFDAMNDLLKFLHVSANLLWIGSILSVALLLTRGPGDAVARGQAGTLVYRTLAVPAFVVAFALGVTQLVLAPNYYFKVTHFMHGKLVLVVVVIGLHHVLGARARRMAKGEVAQAGPTAALAWGLALAAVGSVWLVVTKPF